MLKIYEDARVKIDRYLNLLVGEYGLTKEEVSFKVLAVEEKRVEFEIHEKLKVLIEEQYEAEEQQFSQVKFHEHCDSLWGMEIWIGGVESHFFAMLLEKVALGLKKDKSEKIMINKNIITTKVTGLINENTSIKSRVFYRKGNYYVILRANGTRFPFKGNNVSELCAALERDVPAVLTIAAVIANHKNVCLIRRSTS